MATLDHARLKEVLGYDPSTGVFRWLRPPSPRVAVGAQAGAVGVHGRRYIGVDGNKFLAPRLAWLYVHGEWPKGDVRQTDENFDNCAISNLEVVSRSVASRNRALDVRNKSGYRGVSVRDNGKFAAFITRHMKQVFLGEFDTPQAASAAYETAASELDTAVAVGHQVAAANAAKVRRRLRVAWKKLLKIEKSHGWSSYEDFTATVNDVSPRHSVRPVKADEPIGPDNFAVVADLSTGFDLSTRDGRIAYFRAHRKDNPEIYRDRELKKGFGIGLDRYNQILSTQNFVCAICEKPENVERGGKPLSLAVDHDHATGAIRGILCANCNHGLGKFCDDPGLLRNAIVYLSKHKPMVQPHALSPGRDWLSVATMGFGV